METVYTLRFADGREQELRVAVDPATLERTDLPPDSGAAWTKLEFEQCRGCKLSSADSPRCPVAASLEPVVSAIEDVMSHEKVDVTVLAEGREIRKRVPLQEALKSIIGLLMVTSGCPAFAKLKPLARFHLPFATTEETGYRVAGMHLLAQYFRGRQGLPVDTDFSALNEMYAEIHRVNVDFTQRLRRGAETDAHLNGMVDLDCLTVLVPMMLRKDLPGLKALFEPYLK